ncbi:MAG: phosphatase PAP2 family protein [Acidimicrobiales bacterium]|jgi:undecaprenyl-diphosphatase
MAEVHQMFPADPADEFEPVESSVGHPLGPVGDALDKAVDRLWEPLRGNPTLDRVFYTASELGDFSLLWHIAGLSQGLTRRNGHRSTVRLALALGAESALVNGAIKSMFHRERPVHEEERPHDLRQPLTSSFPSGHASAAFMAATLLSERSKTKPLWFGAAAVVAVSRLHVRIHHASDVLVGAGIGLTLGKVIKTLMPRR